MRNLCLRSNSRPTALYRLFRSSFPLNVLKHWRASRLKHRPFRSKIDREQPWNTTPVVRVLTRWIARTIMNTHNNTLFETPLYRDGRSQNISAKVIIAFWMRRKTYILNSLWTNYHWVPWGGFLFVLFY